MWGYAAKKLNMEQLLLKHNTVSTGKAERMCKSKKKNPGEFTTYNRQFLLQQQIKWLTLW